MRSIHKTTVYILFSLWLCLFLSVSCGRDSSSSDESETTAEVTAPIDPPTPYSTRPADESVIKVQFTGDTAIVDLHDMDNHSVHLMKVNRGKEVVSSEDTGNVITYTGMAQTGDVGTETGESLERNSDKTEDLVCGIAGNREFRFANPDAAYTLQASGTYSQIWVADDAGAITAEQARELAVLFDRIYPVESKPFGFDTKNTSPIVIKVYNATDDSGGYYFGGKQFYLNANSATFNSRTYISTMIHEFLHLIQFVIGSGAPGGSPYVEGLAVLAVDIFGPLIGIPTTNSQHPSQTNRAAALTSYYKQGIAEWITTEGNFFSYARSYAFFAYLVRNYGGMELFKNLVLGEDDVENNGSWEYLIPAALQKTLSGTNWDLDKVLAKYAEAYVFSGKNIPEGVASFDKTVSSTIDGTPYTFVGFSLWGDSIPAYFPVTEAHEMRPQSIMMHYSSKAWGGRSGDFSVTLSRPKNAEVDLYLMVRKKTGVL